MRFVLLKINGTVATLATTRTCKQFTTKVSDLIFIDTDHNNGKADLIESGHWNTIKHSYNLCGVQPEDYGHTKE